MTRNPPNGIPTKADHLRELDRHTRDMFKPSVRVSYSESEMLFRSVK